MAPHPNHAAATALLDRLTAEQAPLCISPQVCREFLVVLTRQPVEGRSYTVEEVALIRVGGQLDYAACLFTNALSNSAGPT